MNFRRVVLTAAAATLATAPAAQAETTVYFDVAQGWAAQVVMDSSLPYTRFDVTRAGATIGSSTSSGLELGDLVADDVLTIYDGDTIVDRIVYDGLPAIGDDACIGHKSFAVRRAPGAEIVAAGAYDGQDDTGAAWTDAEDAVVSLTRPLGYGEVAYVQTVTTDDETTIYSSRVRHMQLCPGNPAPAPPTATPAPAPSAPPVAPPEVMPSTAQVAQAVKGSLQAAGESLRARTTRKLARSGTLVLPFAFPEAGRVDLELVVRNKTIATGAKTSTVNGKAFVKLQLTAAGRTLLKRSKKLKVTVKGAFTPVRNGAATSSASSTVTLKR